jgi:hypothetical protein
MVPAAFGVTFAAPLTDFEPDQPSPVCPPLATHVAAFVEVQVSVTGFPTTTEAGAAAKLTVGAVTVTVTAVAVSLRPFAMQFKPYWYAPADASVTDRLPLAASVPIQVSAVDPPEAVQTAPGVLAHVKVTGTPAVTVAELAVNETAKVPLPAKLSITGLTPALTLSVAVLDPAEVGSNMTLIEQLAPTATEVPQVLVWENEPAFAPPNVMLVMGSGTAAVFVTVTALGALGTFID